MSQPERIKCGYLPSGLDLSEIHWEYKQLPHNIELALPRLTPSQLLQLGQYLQTQAQQQLASLSVLDIAQAIDRCITYMLQTDHPERQRMELALQAQTGYDPEMLRLGINACLRTFRRPELLRLLCEDLQDPTLLDDFRPRVQGGWSRAYGPKLLGLIWAGNVPGIPLWSQVASLLVKSPSIGKLASDEPIFASWFAQSLAKTAPEIAQSLAVIWWPGGEQQSESTLLQQVDVLLVYGSDTTLTAWQQQVPSSVRFLPHGHKFSAAVISNSALGTLQAQHCAQRIALDIAQWDQQACYAPQSIYVQRGGQVNPNEFAQLVAAELQALQHRYPRRSLGLNEKNQLAQWRQSIDLRAMRGEHIERLGQSEASWTVMYFDNNKQPEPSPTHRSVSIIAVDNINEVTTQLQPFRRYLQTVAIAASPEELFTLAPQLAQVGVNRLCALGATAQPQSGWHHDGRFSLLDFIRMVDIEASAEQLAQDFASYRD